MAYLPGGPCRASRNVLITSWSSCRMKLSNECFTGDDKYRTLKLEIWSKRHNLFKRSTIISFIQTRCLRNDDTIRLPLALTHISSQNLPRSSSKLLPSGCHTNTIIWNKIGENILQTIRVRTNFQDAFNLLYVRSLVWGSP